MRRKAGKEPHLRGDERRGETASREWRSRTERGEGRKGWRKGERGGRERKGGAPLLSADETGVNRLNCTTSNQSAPQGQKGGRSGQDRQVQDREHCPR